MRLVVSIYLLTSVLTAIYAGNTLGGWDSHFGRAPLLERYSWKILDFAYPDEASRKLALSMGEFIPENALPVGIEIWRNKLFVTVPRWRNGELYFTFNNFITSLISVIVLFFLLHFFYIDLTNIDPRFITKIIRFVLTFVFFHFFFMWIDI